MVHDIKVIEGEKGLFIAMPSKKSADGEYRDIAHPINSGTREHMQTLILTKYEETIELEEAAAEAEEEAEEQRHYEELVEYVNGLTEGELRTRLLDALLELDERRYY